VQEVELTWADRLLEKGREEGREAGVIEGKRKTLLRQLSAKFGAIPEGVRARTEAMTESGATPTARLPLVERLGPTPRGEIGLGWRSRAGP